jgi:4-hydroxy-tetrahydrodipicolinate synthase
MDGLYTALVTPVKDGKVDRRAMSELINHVIDGGSDGLVVLGGTGEYASLSYEQRVDAIKITIEENKKRVPVMVGILSTGLPEAIMMGKLSKELGADSAMLITPFYVTPSQKGIMNYYLSFDEAVNLPLVLYNIPFRTNSNLLPETVAEILKRTGNVVGMKETSPSYLQATQLMAYFGDKITFFCGEEPLLYPQLLAGCRGAILASSNLFPSFFKEMIRRVESEDLQGAREMHFELIPFLKSAFAECNPGPLKAAMKHVGLDCGDALLPLLPPGPELLERLYKDVDNLKAWINKNNL